MTTSSKGPGHPCRADTEGERALPGRLKGRTLDHAAMSKQGRSLANAARLVKPGGRLVYATCSLLAEENEAQVKGLIAAYPEFSSLTPARHGTGS